MKCIECVDYAECSKKHNLTIKRKHCPMAKVEYVQTNADRIRAMSDNELAKAFSEHCKGMKTCAVCPLDEKSCAESEAVSDWLEWLKQPAEGE